ncbi:hypothetical protein H0H92_013420 [Tricholoma furcatifolium]|nr:hypothetical protein H0H92_013420 [Tricholoma furcatifolium]
MTSGSRLDYIQLLADNLNDLTNPLNEDSIISASRNNITAKTLGKSITGWMRLYTDSCLLRSFADLEPSTALESIARLDSVIITCGIASGRLDFILDTIKSIQRSYLSFDPQQLHVTKILDVTCHQPQSHNLQSAQSEILVLLKPPSLASFQKTFSKNPFALRSYAHKWPALVEHPWRSAAYLKSVSGPGRVVPVEVGNDYRDPSWTQKLMAWDDFLACLDLDDQFPSPSNAQNNAVYLAQHNLSLQFPELLADIVTPDYVYATLDISTRHAYQPPGNDEQLVTNMWLGPKGTVSPAHTDPYFNLFSRK